MISKYTIYCALYTWSSDNGWYLKLCQKRQLSVGDDVTRFTGRTGTRNYKLGVHRYYHPHNPYKLTGSTDINTNMTSPYHSTHSRRLSQQSFNTSLFYSPSTISINTDFSDCTNVTSASGIGSGTGNTTTDFLFCEWISEVERDQIIASWRGVLARGTF